MIFFFFKQKTAYEMRISDWSSDVCSSDLQSGGCRCRRDTVPAQVAPDRIARRTRARRNGAQGDMASDIVNQVADTAITVLRCAAHRFEHDRVKITRYLAPPEGIAGRHERAGQRSEEHTSELQSLMRISYAVFCLKKKKTQKN